MAHTARITEAGRAAVVAAEGNGLQLEITHIGFASTAFEPDGLEVDSPTEIVRTPIAGSVKLNSTTFQVMASTKAPAGKDAWVGSVTIWAGDILFAVISRAEGNLVYLSSEANVTVNFSLALESLPAESITVMVDAEASATLLLISELMQRLSDLENEGEYLISGLTVTGSPLAISGEPTTITMQNARSAIDGETITSYNILDTDGNLLSQVAVDPNTLPTTADITPAGFLGEAVDFYVVPVDGLSNHYRRVKFTTEISNNLPPNVANAGHTLPSEFVHSSTGQFSIFGATDPDGDVVTYRVGTDLPTELSFSPNSGIAENQNVTWTTADGLDEDATGAVSIYAADENGGEVLIDQVAVTILANLLPDVTNASVSGLPSEMQQNSSGAFSVSGATDADGDVITYRVASDLPANVLNFSPASGVAEGGSIAWTTGYVSEDQAGTVWVYAIDEKDGEVLILSRSIAIRATPEVLGIQTDAIPLAGVGLGISDNGRWLVVPDGMAIRIFELDSSGRANFQSMVPLSYSGYIRAMSISDDGETISISMADGIYRNLAIIDYIGGTWVESYLTADYGNQWKPYLGADGLSMSFMTKTPNEYPVHMYKRTSKNDAWDLHFNLNEHLSGSGTLFLSPSGEKMAIPYGTVAVADGDGGNAVGTSASQGDVVLTNDHLIVFAWGRIKPQIVQLSDMTKVEKDLTGYIGGFHRSGDADKNGWVYAPSNGLGSVEKLSYSNMTGQLIEPSVPDASFGRDMAAGSGVLAVASDTAIYIFK